MSVLPFEQTKRRRSLGSHESADKFVSEAVIKLLRENEVMQEVQNELALLRNDIAASQREIEVRVKTSVAYCERAAEYVSATRWIMAILVGLTSVVCSRSIFYFVFGW